MSSCDIAAGLEAVEQRTDPVNLDTANVAAVEGGSVVFNVLAQICSGRALAIIRQVPRGNGWECWRRLSQEYEPATGARFAGMLSSILKPSWQGLSLARFGEALYDWETLVSRYETQSAQIVAPTLKVAIVLGQAPASVQQLLRTQLGIIGDDFAVLRTVITQLAATERSLPDADGGTAMEVDAVTRGFGSSGARGACFNCGKLGHRAAECRQGKGRGKGGGKAGKGGRGGKGRADDWRDGGRDSGGKPTTQGFHGQCGRCKAYGHKRADCPRGGGRTAAVAAEPAGEPPALGAGAGDVGAVSSSDSAGAVDSGWGGDAWVMAAGSSGPAASSSPLVLLDSGSDEHVCPVAWREDLDLKFDDPGRNTVLRDVQGNVIRQLGSRRIMMDMPAASGDGTVRAGAEFRVADVREPLLSAGKVVRNGGVIHLDAGNSYLALGTRRVAIEAHGNRFHLRALPGDGLVAAAVADAACAAAPPAVLPAPAPAPDPSSTSSSSFLADTPMQGAGGDGEEPAVVGPPVDAVDIVPRPRPTSGEQAGERKLYAWSLAKDLRARLAELGQPSYGDKDTLWLRLKKAEEARQRDLEVAEALAQQQARGVDLAQVAEPRGPPVPGEPSAEERARHALSHCPAASWCVHCLRGKSQATPHARIQWTGRADAAPLLCFDFCYMKGEGADGQVNDQFATTLVVACENTGMSLSIAAPGKSVAGENGEYMAAAMVSFIDKVLRHRSIQLQHDGEPACLALSKLVVARRSHDTRERQNPRHSSASNGLAEAKIKQVQGQCRAMRLALEARYGGLRLSCNHVAWARPVRHASWLLNRFQPGSSGRVPFAQLNAVPWNGEVVEFGETVVWRQSFPHHRLMKGKERQHKGDPCWHRGVWWGRAEETDEQVIGTPKGIVLTRSIRRLAPSEAADLTLMESVRGLPWDPRRGVDAELAKRRKPMPSFGPVVVTPPGRPGDALAPSGATPATGSLPSGSAAASSSCGPPPGLEADARASASGDARASASGDAGPALDAGHGGAGVGACGAAGASPKRARGNDDDLDDDELQATK